MSIGTVHHFTWHATIYLTMLRQMTLKRRAYGVKFHLCVSKIQMVLHYELLSSISYCFGKVWPAGEESGYQRQRRPWGSRHSVHNFIWVNVRGLPEDDRKVGRSLCVLRFCCNRVRPLSTGIVGIVLFAFMVSRSPVPLLLLSLPDWLLVLPGKGKGSFLFPSLSE